jgi:Putative transmembrane protein (PGPGW)
VTGDYPARMIRRLTVVGAAAVLLGLVLVPLPGPGWSVVALGALVLLAAAVVRHLPARATRR